MRVYTIYKATNKLNGKSYIGYDSKWPRRKTEHLSFKEGCPYFHRALVRYGTTNFEWEILYQSKEREYTLKIMEPYFIQEYDTYRSGYNLTKGGEGTFGRVLSIEGRQKVRKARLGKSLSKEVKDKIAASQKQRFLNNPKLRLDRSIANSERLKGLSGDKNYFFGKQHTEEAKIKIKEAVIERHRKRKQMENEVFSVSQTYSAME